jgi:hypothetical protein
MVRLHVRRPERLSATVAAALLASLIAALGACTGRISAPKDSPVGTTGSLCTGGPTSPGPSYIRRVNRLEYNNTVHDLLADTSAPADSFPAEEVSLGFDNNAQALSVSPVLAEQYLDAAESLATTAVNTNWAKLVPCAPTITDAAAVDACGQAFIMSFGQRAYRRPPDADDVAALTAAFNAGKATDIVTGVRLAIEAALQSPRFLYRVELGGTPPAGATVVQLDDWEMASRLSYLLWHSMPDDALFSAAAAGKLTAPADIEAQVQRMIADPKAHGVVADFHAQWLRVGEISGVEKDATIFPAFTPAIAQLMQQETARFLDYVTWNGAAGGGPGDLTAILTAPFTFVNGPLAQYYGMTGVSGSAFVKTPLDGTHRAGVLGQGGLLSLLAKANQTSPVHRGKFVREQLLCMQLPPPPANLMIKPPELSATLSTRQRFTQHSIDPACTPCHHLMDPIGLGFEDFDGAGVFRALENGQPIDDSGEVEDSDVGGTFHGVGELTAKLASSDQVRTCVATRWFRYGYGRGETSADTCSLSTIQSQFASGGFKIRDLLIALTRTDAFRYRQVTPAGGP